MYKFQSWKLALCSWTSALDTSATAQLWDAWQIYYGACYPARFSINKDEKGWLVDYGDTASVLADSILIIFFFFTFAFLMLLTK